MAGEHIKAYCTRCKEKSELENPHVKHNIKGGLYAYGKCVHCGKKNTVAISKSYLGHIPEKDREHLKQGGFLPLLLAAIPAIAAAASGVAGIVNNTRATNAQIEALKGVQGKGLKNPRKKDIVAVNELPESESDILKALHSHMHSAKAFHKEYKNLKHTLKGHGLFLPSGNGLYLN